MTPIDPERAEPWINRQIDAAAERLVARTGLETFEGLLVHAEVGEVSLDSTPGSGLVVLTVEHHSPYRHLVSTTLTAHEVGMLTHALACSLWPYGEPPAKP